MSGHIYILFILQRNVTIRKWLCVHWIVIFNFIYQSFSEGLHIPSWWFWDPQGAKATMPLPLRVVKRKGKKKFNGIVASIKTCAPWAIICARKGVGFCIHYIMKIGQQATNGHHNYILFDIQYEDWLGILKTWNTIFSLPLNLICSFNDL